MQSTSLAHTPVDAALLSSIHSAINSSPDVDPLVLTVTYADGVVTLSGEVRNFAERVAAAELAMGVHGVLAVTNNITVRPLGGGWAITDDAIRKSIAAALVAGFPDLPEGSIGIDARYHVVTLTGRVTTNRSRNLIRHIVESVPGVDFVQNQITLN